jgi:hypothetical protein
MDTIVENQVDLEMVEVGEIVLAAQEAQTLAVVEVVDPTI